MALVYVTDIEYQADIKVFAVNERYQADLCFFEVDRDYKANTEAKWFFEDKDYKATVNCVRKKYQKPCIKSYILSTEFNLEDYK